MKRMELNHTGNGTACKIWKKILICIVLILCSINLFAEITKEDFEKLVDMDLSKAFSGKQVSLNPITNASYIDKAINPKEVGSFDEVKWDKDGRIHYFKIRALFREFDSKYWEILLSSTNTEQGFFPYTTPSESDFLSIIPINNPALSESVWLPAPPLSSFSNYNLPAAYTIFKDKTFRNMVADFYIATGTWQSNTGKEQGFVEIIYINIVGLPIFYSKDFMVAVNFKMIDSYDNYDWSNFITGFSENIFNPYNFVYADPYDIMLVMEVAPEQLETLSIPNWQDKNKLFYSEVIFSSQTNTSILVTNKDKTFVKSMTFMGRTSSLKNGDKIRIYYSVEKKTYSTDWTIYAIEKIK